MKTGGIYGIVHVSSGKTYVGQTTSFTLRWKKHKTDLDAQVHHNHKLQSLWSAGSPEHFHFRVLHELPDGLTELQARRWLARAEYKAYTELRDAGLALNIIAPDIVETPAAVKEYKVERKNRAKQITQQLGDLKPIQQEAKALSWEAQRAKYDAEQAAAAAKDLVTRNSGWRRFLFGSTTEKSPTELQSELAARELALQEARRKQEEADAEATRLAQEAT